LASPQCKAARYGTSTASETRIALEHVLGSGAIPPSFPAVLIDGEYYWDGGVYSNSPIEVIFGENPRRNSVVFAVRI
jgi:NTE family protein